MRAESVDAKEIWRVDVAGQARGLAVAHGRLFVSTDQGEIHCFASSGPGSETAFEPRSDLLDGKQPKTSLSSLDSSLQRQFESRGIDRGYVLVLGDAEGTISKAIAAETQLHVINVLRDRHAVTLLRNRLLDTTPWYGSRIHVKFIKTGSPLPFSPYFANAVIVSGEGSSVPIAELYRTLRPCGGIMLFPEMNAAAARKLIAAGKIPPEEIVGEDRPLIERGQLPGSLEIGRAHV